jgi:hypothetical protein
MSHRSSAGITSKRIALTLAVSAFLSVGSPLVATSSASNGGGAQRPVSANFGDCKNDNSGLHRGYVCPTTDGGGSLVT